MRVIKVITIVAIAILPTLSNGQTVRISIAKGGFFCGFSTEVKGGYYSSAQQAQYITERAKAGDRYGIYDVVSEIKAILNIRALIDVYVAEAENNAMATTGAGGRKIIIADYNFLKTVNRDAGTEWAAISILAHELGHHIAGLGRGLSGELDADYWSGYVLYKLGASKEASIKCIMHFGTEQNTSSHPNKYLRAKTIKQGWDDAANGSYDPARCRDCD